MADKEGTKDERVAHTRNMAMAHGSAYSKTHYYLIMRWKLKPFKYKCFVSASTEPRKPLRCAIAATAGVGTHCGSTGQTLESLELLSWTLSQFSRSWGTLLAALAAMGDEAANEENFRQASAEESIDI